MNEEELWNEDDSANQGMFLLMKAAIIKGDDSEDNLARCDIDNIGPVAVNWEPGHGFIGKPRYAEWRPRPVDSTLKEFSVLVNYYSHFFFVYVARGNQNADGEWEIDGTAQYYEGTHTFVSETGSHCLGGFFRLMWEWAQIYDEPFNERYACAVYSKKVFETLPFTPEILAEIQSWPDQAVFRYIKGEQDININERLPGPYLLSDNFKNWFREVMHRFRSGNLEHMEEL